MLNISAVISVVEISSHSVLELIDEMSLRTILTNLMRVWMKGDFDLDQRNLMTNILNIRICACLAKQIVSLRFFGKLTNRTSDSPGSK